MLREGGMVGRGKKCLQFVHQFGFLSEKELVSVPRNLLLLLLFPKKNTKFFQANSNGLKSGWFWNQSLDEHIREVSSDLHFHTRLYKNS